MTMEMKADDHPTLFPSLPAAHSCPPLSLADGPWYCFPFTGGDTEALTLIKVIQFIHQGLKARSDC